MELTRRQMIQAAGTLGVATLTGVGPRSAFGQGQSSGAPNKKVGWAILGLGGYALNQILPNMKFCQHGAPVALISGSPDKAKATAAAYGIKESMIFNYDNMDRIKDVAEIDVVYVITPPGTHRDFTIRALQAGKHVCCEKPMASSAKDCEAMIAATKRAKRLLQIGYRCHFEPNNLEAMRICRAGEIGQIRTIRSDHAFTMGWDNGWHSKKGLGGFGAISEIGIYSINALCYLAGEDPIEIFGTRDKVKADRFKDVEDVNHFNLKFPGGAQGVGMTGYSWNANNFRAYGDRGQIDAEPATGYGGHNFRKNGQPFRVEPANMWALQMDDLSRAILDSSRILKTPGEMGLRDIRIIEAVLQSADTGKSVRFSPTA